MINNTAIDVAIGLFFIYALYSLLTTALTELIASWFNQRGKILKMGIKRMLDTDDPENSFFNNLKMGIKIMWSKEPENSVPNKLTMGIKSILGIVKPKNSVKNLSSEFFAKPEIKYLGKEKITGNTRFQSDLKPNTFVSSLLDILKIKYSKSSVLATIDLASIKQNLDPKNETHQVLINLIDRADNNVNQFKILTEDWFNETMERVTGWYKRRMQLITIIVGALIAFSLNINTIEISKVLSENDEARIAMVEAASSYMSSIKDSKDSLQDKKSLEELNKEVRALIQETKNAESIMNIPRPKFCSEENKVSWLSYIFGCLITTIALSLGSPFWFDLLSKLIKLRSSGTEEKTTNNNSPSKQPVG